MQQHPGFLQDIVANPEDDTPRLIYADWLDDHDQAEHAEIIRSECKLAQIPLSAETAEERERLTRRVFYLRARIGRSMISRKFRRLIKRRAKGGAKWSSARGFVDSLRLSVSGFNRVAEDAFQEQPIQKLTLVSRAENLQSLPERPELSRIRSLILRFHYSYQRGQPADPVEDVNVLFQSPHLTKLRELDVTRFYVRPEAMNPIINCPALDGIQSLALGPPWSTIQPGPGTSGIHRFLAHPSTRDLRSLSIHTGWIQNPMEAIMRSKQVEQLERLEIRQLVAFQPGSPYRTFTPTAEDWRRLFTGLKVLHLPNGSYLRRDYLDLETVFRWPEVRNLTSLDLSSMKADYSIVDALVGANLPQLTELSLQNMEESVRHLSKLLAAPCLANVTVLDLSSCRLYARNMPKLFRPRYLPKLARLDLHNNPFGDDGLKALVASPNLENLWWLDLRQTGLTRESEPMLLELKEKCPHLVWLDVRKNDFGPEDCQRLRAVFGPSVRYPAWPWS